MTDMREAVQSFRAGSPRPVCDFVVDARGIARDSAPGRGKRGHMWNNAKNEIEMRMQFSASTARVSTLQIKIKIVFVICCNKYIIHYN